MEEPLTWGGEASSTQVLLTSALSLSCPILFAAQAQGTGLMFPTNTCLVLLQLSLVWMAGRSGGSCVEHRDYGWEILASKSLVPQVPSQLQFSEAGWKTVQHSIYLEFPGWKKLC